MANFAVINDGVVVNVIIADSKEVAETVTGLDCVEYETSPSAPGIGWSYDGSVFTAPVTE
jgi:hypothetical protein